MRILRRISSAFKTIPGGQVLGSTSDYEQRILDFSLADETAEAQRSTVEDFEAGAQESAGLPGAGPLEPERFRKVVDILREQHLVSPLPSGNPSPPTDITQESAAFPLDRSGRLQMLARAETGGVLALAYSSMRGYGSVHPNVAELRVGRVMVRIPHPFRKGETITLGSIVVTEVEVVASVQRSEGDETPAFSLGYGACFGHNEVKAISTAVVNSTG